MAGAYFSREFAILARNLAEAYFGRPRLVRETSRVRAARRRDLASFVFGKAVRAPLAVVKDRARVAGEESLLIVRIVVDSVGNGASIIGSWLRDKGTTLLDVCRALGRFVKNLMMALVELLGLIAFAVTARLKVLSKRVALPKNQAAARLAAFDLRAQLNGVAAFKRKDAARMRGERRDGARKARVDATDRRRARLAKRIIARDRRAARAAAARALRRARVADARSS